MHSQKTNDQAGYQLVKQNWLTAYQIISELSHPDISFQVREAAFWVLEFVLLVCLFGVFLPSRHLNTSAYWNNCVGDHTSNYEQPYVYPPTVFSHCFHYNRKLCQGCSLWGSSFTSSSQTEKTFWFCWRESLLPSPSPFKSVKLLKSYHFTCLLTGRRVNLTAQYFPALHPSSHLVHELQKSSPGSVRFRVGEQRKGGGSTLSSSNLRSLPHVPQI